jgi:hypothetical protein
LYDADAGGLAGWLGSDLTVGFGLVVVVEAVAVAVAVHGAMRWRERENA